MCYIVVICVPNNIVKNIDLPPRNKHKNKIIMEKAAVDEQGLVIPVS